MSEQPQAVASQPNDERNAEYAKLISQMTCAKCAKLMESPIYEKATGDTKRICSKCYEDLPSILPLSTNSQKIAIVPVACVPPPVKIIARAPPCAFRPILVACEVSPPEKRENYTRASLNFESLTKHIHSYHCSNAGCDDTIKLAVQVQHHRMCKFRKVTCCFCKWNEEMARYEEHAKAEHSFSIISQNESEENGVDFELNKMENGQVQNYLQIFDENVFKINCIKKDDQFILWIQCYGLPLESKQYMSVFLLESSGWKIEKEGCVVNDLEAKPPSDSISLETGLLQKIGVSPDTSTPIKFKIVKSQDSTGLASTSHQAAAS